MGLDTMKIRFRGHHLADLDNRQWDRIFKPYPEGTVEIWRSNHRSDREPGAFVQYIPRDDEGVIEFSAKILRENYLEGVSDRNFDHVLNRVWDTNRILLDVDRLHETGVVLRADAAANVHTPDKSAAVLACRAKLRWPYKRKDDRFSSSLLLYNTREQINIYDKAAELKPRTPTPAGRFCLYRHLQEQVADVVRVEYRATRKKTLAQAYGAGIVVDKRLKNPRSGKMELYTVTEEITRPADVLPEKHQNEALRKTWARLKTTEVGALREHRGIFPGINPAIFQFATERQLTWGQLRAHAGHLYLWLAAGGSRASLASALSYLPARTRLRAITETVASVALLDPALAACEDAFADFEQRFLDSVA